MGVMSMQMASIEQIQNKLESAVSDQTTKKEIKDQLDVVKNEIKAYKNDKIFYRIVVGILGVTIISIIIAITILLLNKISGFDALTAIGSAAIGGLVGLLAPSPAGGK